MRLVTWNLDGLDDQALDVRTEAAVFTTILGARLDQLHQGTKATPPPDVIVFQEVVARTLLAHLVPHLSAGGYTVLPTEPPDRQTFEVIAYRDPYTLRAYESEPLRDSVYGRVLHVAEFDSPTGIVRVLTAHFDSGTDAGPVRVAQLHQVSEHLGVSGVFGGDANLRKAEWLSVRDSVPMSDAWETLGEPAATRVTWRRDDYKARFDRVFVGPGLGAKSMRALGTEPLPLLNVPISDHIGLAVELTVDADRP
jgi:endonuclease/exonuclease/phosphatase family metal-dependent hydrolase